MTSDIEGAGDRRDLGAARPGRPGVLAALGVSALLAAGLLLWSSEGAAIFVGQAFAALAACF